MNFHFDNGFGYASHSNIKIFSIEISTFYPDLNSRSILYYTAEIWYFNRFCQLTQGISIFLLFWAIFLSEHNLAFSARPSSCPSLIRIDRCIRCIFGLSILVDKGVFFSIFTSWNLLVARELMEQCSLLSSLQLTQTVISSFFLFLTYIEPLGQLKTLIL